MLNKLLILLLIIIAISFADIQNAHKIRRANRFVEKAEYSKALNIYKDLPVNKKNVFNKGFILNLMEDKQGSEDQYQKIINDPNVYKNDKAKVYLNLGNDALQRGEIKEAKQFYKAGLKCDSKNKKLKNNLEMANSMKLVEQKQQKKDKSNDKDKKEQKENPDKQEQKNKTSQQKNAEKMLDSFKEQEQEDLNNRMQQQEKNVNVEKDW